MAKIKGTKFNVTTTKYKDRLVERGVFIARMGGIDPNSYLRKEIEAIGYDAIRNARGGKVVKSFQKNAIKIDAELQAKILEASTQDKDYKESTFYSGRNQSGKALSYSQMASNMILSNRTNTTDIWQWLKARRIKQYDPSSGTYVHPDTGEELEIGDDKSYEAGEQKE